MRCSDQHLHVRSPNMVRNIDGQQNFTGKIMKQTGSDNADVLMVDTAICSIKKQLQMLLVTLDNIPDCTIAALYLDKSIRELPGNIPEAGK